MGDDLRGLAELFKSISNEHRLKILFTLALKGSTTFTDLSNELNISGGKLNFHLRKLRGLGLVTATESGTYELTEMGKWVVARVVEIARRAERLAPIVDFRGLPYPLSSVSEIARGLNCGKDLGDIESFLSRLLAKHSGIQREGVSGEMLTLLAEAMFCEREPSIVCVPRSLNLSAYKSLVDEECAHLRETVLQDLAHNLATEEISIHLKSFQSKGLIYVRDPARSIKGAQTVALTVPRGVKLARILSKLVNVASELVLVLEEPDVEELEGLHRLIPPGRVTLVLQELYGHEIAVNGFGLVYQLNGDSIPSKLIAALANNAVPLILNGCENVPSLSLAEVPFPEPGEAYVIPLRVALSLPTLYVEMRAKGLDGYHLITLIAEECARASERLSAPAVRRALRDIAESVVELEPQLALVGFEAAMLLHHRQLRVHQLLELSSRFWSTVAKDLPVRLTAAMADERVYSLSRAQGFTALSPFSPASQRTLDEFALLEGTVQRMLRGGSVLAVRVKGYLSTQLTEKVITIMKNQGVLRASFHLEFTKCTVCATLTAGRSGICSKCLSGEVHQLIRPLTVYVPSHTVPPEVLAEYESRMTLS